MTDIVEAMARAAHDANPGGFRPWDDLARAAAEGSTFAAVVMEAQRDAIRAAISSCHDAGGLVLREVPGRMPWPNYQEYMQRTAGWNAALAAVRAAAVEVGP